MSEEPTSSDIKKNVLSLVHSKKEVPEDVKKEEESNSEWIHSFVDSVVANMIQEAVSDVTGVSIVIVHADGGVSHAHKCEQESLIQLIGALEVKKLRMINQLG